MAAQAGPSAAGPSKEASKEEAPAAPPIADATSIQQLLQAAGCEDYEPRVVNLLVDFLHSYTTTVLVDAEAYGEISHRAPGVVGMDDVMLAIQSRSVYSFVQPPSNEVLAEAARQINSTDLPRHPSHRPGLLIPDDKECLTAQNYQLTLDS